ncbi:MULTISPECIES: DUF1656 domain-containing protein [Burkholderia]|uniref:DUF1656 domain-containing protein n=1 Tax=Burkholderia savannae TaxID=1637837 RepID=A0ABR5T8D5_9BURK|nr:MULTISPECIES: DUF1656 domain-containing protein [Burkholderia]AOJ72441.1 hypothetical protein WS78_27420 [Burkholderia savannae]AOJ82918.1 hypothetical protein WS86_19490 [Burkholderia savannae]AOK50835.1 hypothetical protein WT60_29210 [Burkholderia sp. MSMB617WGS]KGR93077.1 hypothetical protein X946_1861 [Burkholderia sp. ABCPW 111]KVG46231.1 hypothetical protein WS77_31270 [Burkholderia sp. MSMB0265]
MLSEFAVAGVYLPPFFVYACATVPLYLAVRAALARAGLLRRVWHPALFEFAVSLVLVAALILFL